MSVLAAAEFDDELLARIQHRNWETGGKRQMVKEQHDRERVSDVALQNRFEQNVVFANIRPARRGNAEFFFLEEKLPDLFPFLFRNWRPSQRLQSSNVK